ncbi:MAG: cytochrome-c oxidase, cbb3-type subunit III [Gammaproteobacteria bacterium]|nr:cytochrome-c oxidase, cbb3-type subunit III [Gammaproteobacteria bacterium]MDH5591851.1 cytochrome-c oxidase, cbb3-type subunit III [Gammaproteobacteria bacterium]
MADNKNNPNQVSDTGHEWDGIKELNNPCPRWWLNSLWLSGLLVIVYFILYPSLPLVNESTKGLLGWTMIKEYKEDLAKVEAKRAPFEDKLAAMTAEEILADQEMLNYAIGSSKVLFGDNCAACHGTGGAPAEGAGYPNLSDDDWLFGGSVNDIMMSIAKGRAGMMPAHEKLLNTDEVDQLVKFVVDSSNGIQNEAGMALYTSKGCFACHGADAKGIKAMGSANLTDKIWRFSGDEDQIRHTILHGVNDASDPQTRVAVMPQWSEKLAIMLQVRADAIADDEDPNDIDWSDELEGDEGERLTETEIKKLAVYVHQFGGGQ